jgi:hypothetical protein
MQELIQSKKFEIQIQIQIIDKYLKFRPSKKLQIFP